MQVLSRREYMEMGKDKLTWVVNIKKLTGKLSTTELISIINEDLRLPKINTIKSEV